MDGSYSDDSDSTNNGSNRPNTLGFFLGSHSEELLDDDIDTAVNADDLVDYDVERSTEHSYMGRGMQTVSGVQWLEEGEVYTMPLVRHCSIVFPGDSIPIMFSDSDVLADAPMGENNEEGLLFGLVFPKTRDNRVFGITCQIYEMDPMDGGLIRVKSRTRQRFEITRQRNPFFFDKRLRPHVFMRPGRLLARITILPEQKMCDPMFGVESNSLSKFRHNTNSIPRLRRMTAAGLIWPTFVYDMYDMQSISVRIKSFLSAMQMTNMPEDEVALSFWCGKNVLMDTDSRMQLFRTNSVIERMRLIGKALDYSRYFVCKKCISCLAHYNSLFAMSKEGFQATYCNSSGFIHETITLTGTIPNAIYLQGPLTAEYSWFPGYSWQLAFCESCNAHLGWKFTAPLLSNLKPRSFYGLAGKSIGLLHKRLVTLPDEQSDPEDVGNGETETDEST